MIPAQAAYSGLQKKSDGEQRVSRKRKYWNSPTPLAVKSVPYTISYPIGNGFVGISRVSFPNMAVSD